MKKCLDCGKEFVEDVYTCDNCGYVFLGSTSAITSNSITNKIEMNQVKWIVAAVISFILSVIMIYKGYDKMTNYYISEYSSISTNAYVGGDAYNYIINGTYATSFFVLATMFSLMGIGFIIINYISKRK